MQGLISHFLIHIRVRYMFATVGVDHYVVNALLYIVIFEKRYSRTGLELLWAIICQSLLKLA